MDYIHYNNIEGVAGWAGHTCPSGKPDVTFFFVVLLLFFCFVFFVFFVVFHIENGKLLNGMIPPTCNLVYGTLLWLVTRSWIVVAILIPDNTHLQYEWYRWQSRTCILIWSMWCHSRFFSNFMFLVLKFNASRFAFLILSFYRYLLYSYYCIVYVHVQMYFVLVSYFHVRTIHLNIDEFEFSSCSHFGILYDISEGCYLICVCNVIIFKLWKEFSWNQRPRFFGLISEDDVLLTVINTNFTNDQKAPRTRF